MENPSLCRILRIREGWYLIPNRRLTKSAIIGEVHTSVSRPLASGPASMTSDNSFICRTDSLGGVPWYGPLEISAHIPSARYVADQRFTVVVPTSHSMEVYSIEVPSERS
jgi:hypothetical protein